MTKPETVVHNPLMWADVPDVDVIRVGDIFYMVSTSMHSMPGCPIMKSKDLAHWELVSYVFDTFEDTPGHNLLDGKGVYGQGRGRPVCGIIRGLSMYASTATTPISSTFTGQKI